MLNNTREGVIVKFLRKILSISMAFLMLFSTFSYTGMKKADAAEVKSTSYAASDDSFEKNSNSESNIRNQQFVDLGKLTKDLQYKNSRTGSTTSTASKSSGGGTYTAQDTTSGTISIVSNDPILMIGQTKTVTLTVTNNGQAYSDQIIEVQGFGTGTTDALGQVKFAITPQWTYKIPVNVNGTWYYEVLYALSPSQGLIQTTFLDRNGAIISDYDVSARQMYNGWQDQIKNNDVIRIIAEQGMNTLSLAGENALGEGYYITKDINVNPGVLNPYVITASPAETVQANIHSNYYGAPMSGSKIYFEFQGKYPYENNWSMNLCAGTLDINGGKVSYVTPGIYNVAIKDVNPTPSDDYLYLMKKNININILKYQITRF
jgi:hypothetical protein